MRNNRNRNEVSRLGNYLDTFQVNTQKYLTPAEILLRLGITRHEWLELYFTNRDIEQEKFREVMAVMERNIVLMEKEAIEKPWKARQIYSLLEVYFPDLYSKVKFNIAPKKKENIKILESALNKSGIDF